ncbi:MAG: hypothetical protein ACYDCG_10485 [Candidatus Acidiferrales bacterium]
MRATRTARTAGRRTSLRRAAAKRSARNAKAVPKRAALKSAKPARPAGKLVVAPPEPVLYKLCKPGWAVIVERIPNAQGTRFVCPFCPRSHRVPGPVRGFKKMRRAPWVRLRRVEE